MHPKLKHTFLYSNKTCRTTSSSATKLDGIQRANSDKVRIIHTLTREEPPNRPDVRRGRIDAALLREAIPDPSACIVYACGPAIGPFDKQAAREKGVEPTPRFLEAALAGLAEIGVGEDRIEYESYG